MLISTALLLDSIIGNSVCTPAKLPCRPPGGGGIRKITELIFFMKTYQSFVNATYIISNLSAKLVSGRKNKVV
jgi:hypothetical protein